jgi:hypothetical protein
MSNATAVGCCYLFTGIFGNAFLPALRPLSTPSKGLHSGAKDESIPERETRMR